MKMSWLCGSTSKDQLEDASDYEESVPMNKIVKRGELQLDSW